MGKNNAAAEKPGVKPKASQSREQADEFIDRFQTLVDAQDQAMDLKCEVGGHDYGKVLIIELERMQQMFFEEGGLSPSDDEEYTAPKMAELTNILSETLGQEGLARLEEAADVLVLQALEGKLTEAYNRHDDQRKEIYSDRPQVLEQDAEHRGKKSLDPNFKQKLLTYESRYVTSPYTPQKIAQVEIYLVSLEEIMRDCGIKERDILEKLVEWEPYITQDPQMVIMLFKESKRDAYYTSTPFGLALGLRKDALDAGGNLYQQDPLFMRQLLTAGVNIYELGNLIKIEIIPNLEKISPYKNYFIRILKASGETWSIRSFIEYLLTNLYSYLEKDPEKMTQMIEIASHRAAFLVPRTFGYLQPQIDEKGFTPEVMDQWEAFCKVGENISGDTRDEKEVGPLFQRLWPDIQAQPILMQKLGHFAVDMGGDKESKAYLMTREDILARPNDFIKLLEDALKILNGDKASRDPLWLMQGRVCMAWPYIREEFRANGYSKKLKTQWTEILKMPEELNSDDFGMLWGRFQEKPKDAQAVVKNITNESGNCRGYECFLKIVFPIAKDEFTRKGYTKHIQSYISDMKTLWDKCDDGWLRVGLLTRWGPEIYKKGIQPKHQTRMQFFTEKVKPHLDWEKGKEQVLKIALYLDDPRLTVTPSLEERISTMAEEEKLDNVLRRFESDCSQSFDWFSKEYLSDPAQLIGARMQPSDFPIDETKMKIIIAQLNAGISTQAKRESYSLISIPQFNFDQIYYHPVFQEKLKGYVGAHPGEITYMYGFSLAQVVFRNLTQNNIPLNDNSLAIEMMRCLEAREELKTREIFGPNTQLILFAHEENNFKGDLFVDLYRKSGGPSVTYVKGIEAKEGKNLNKQKILDAIRNARTGPVTLMFDGHGSPENWAFSGNQSAALNHNIYGDEISINYRELGDALYNSGNIENFNILGLTCYGYNYLENLFEYLKSIKGCEKRPYFCFSEANKDSVSFGQNLRWEKTASGLASHVWDGIATAHTEGKPIRVQDLWDSELANENWQWQDPAFFYQGEVVASRSEGNRPEIQSA